MRLFFLTPSLIGSINDTIFILTNLPVVLMGLIKEDIQNQQTKMVKIPKSSYIIHHSDMHLKITATY